MKICIRLKFTNPLKNVVMNNISKECTSKRVPVISYASLVSLIERVEKSETLSRKLCTYDGIKLRIYGKEYINLLLSDEMKKKFRFKSQCDENQGYVISYLGEFRNFSIKIHYASEASVVDISGSIHKWFNEGKHNYNQFYYLDFLIAMKEVIEVFALDAAEVGVVNLEVGVNCILPPCIPLSVKEVIKHIISIVSQGRTIKKMEEKNRESVLVHKGERYYKTYDKGLQNNRADESIIRMEVGWFTSRQLKKDAGIFSLNDLFSIETMDKLNAVLVKSFSALHTFQPELRKLPASVLTNVKEVQHFSSPSFWRDLKKKNRRQYEKSRKLQEKLTADHATYNLRVELLKMLKDSLS